MPEPPAAVVVVAWNRKEETARCLASVFRQDYPSLSVFLVDNGSTDGTLAAVREGFPECGLVVHGENLGFAEGSNAGARAALASGAEYVLFLNNDAVLEPGCLRALVGEARSAPDIGVAGAAAAEPEPPDLDSFWDRRYWKRAHAWLGEFRGASRTADADWVPGCCMLVKAEMIRRIGLFDPDYFAYYEDRDFCLRARRAGWRVRYLPGARMRHSEGSSTGGVMADSPRKSYLVGRNQVLFLKKNGTRAQRLAFLFWLPVKCATLMLGRRLRPDPRAAPAKIRGFYDGLSSSLRSTTRAP